MAPLKTYLLLGLPLLSNAFLTPNSVTTRSIPMTMTATISPDDMTTSKTNFITEKSDKCFSEAQHLMPGGVSSPVRAFKSVGGNPVVFDRVKGAYAWDLDGNQYVDYVGSWGPAICGHANDEVKYINR